MSVRFPNTVNAQLQRTGFTVFSGAWSFFCFYRPTNLAASHTIVTISNGVTSADYISLETGGTGLEVWGDGDINPVATGAGAFSTNNWYGLGLVLNGSGIATTYRALTTAASYTVLASANTPALSAMASPQIVQIGSNPQFGEPAQGDLIGVRLWNVALTAAEMENERHSLMPYRTANLVVRLDLLDIGSKLIDTSGSGNDFTAPGGAGGWTTLDNPPIPWTGVKRKPLLRVPPVTVAATGFDVAVQFGAPSVGVTATGLAVAVGLGTPTATPGAVSKTVTGFDVAVQVGTASVGVTAIGLDVATSFGTPTAAPGAVTRAVAGLDVLVQFGTPVPMADTRIIDALGFDVQTSEGAPTATPGTVIVGTSGRDVGIEYGTPTITTSITRAANGNDIGVTLGTAVGGVVIIKPATGFDVTTQFGTPTAAPGVVVKTVSGLDVAVSTGLVTGSNVAGVRLGSGTIKGVSVLGGVLTEVGTVSPAQPTLLYPEARVSVVLQTHEKKEPQPVTTDDVKGHTGVF